jgi:hypothetical protein
MKGFEIRLARLEDKLRPEALPTILWRAPRESEADAIARHCLANGIEKLPPDTVLQFVTWHDTPDG